MDWLGAAVFAAALWLLWRSHVDLGRNWSAMLQIRKEHKLITQGAYKYIRHPMYAAHAIWAIVAISGTTALIVVRVSTKNQSPQADLQAQHDALPSETFRDAELADPFPPDSELERAEMEAIKRQLDINIFQGTLFESDDGKPEDPKSE